MLHDFKKYKADQRVKRNPKTTRGTETIIFKGIGINPGKLNIPSIHKDTKNNKIINPKKNIIARGVRINLIFLFPVAVL